MSIKIGINGFGRIGRNILRAIIENDNLLACQFHPEKSSKLGEKFLTKFFEMA